MPENSAHGPITFRSRAGKAIGTQRLPFHRWVTKVGSGSGTSPSSQALFAPLAAIACKYRKSDRPKTLSIRQPDAACAGAGAAVSTIAAPAATAAAAHLSLRLMPFFPRSWPTRRVVPDIPVTTRLATIRATSTGRREPFAPLPSPHVPLMPGHHRPVPSAGNFPARDKLIAQLRTPTKTGIAVWLP